MRKYGFLLLISALLVTLPVGPAQWVKAETMVFTDVPSSYWANETIQWAVKDNVVSGYGDGTFKPKRAVSEAEFLTMLFRAFPEISIPKSEAGAPWYAAYYRLAAALKWPVQTSEDGNAFNRGLVARLLAATQGERLGIEASIQFVLDQKLASGKTTATVEGYFPQDELTRAEAVVLIKNMLDRGLTLHPVWTDDSVWESRGEFNVRNISIGDVWSEVSEQLGQPVRKDPSEYGFTWYIYHREYANYAQIGVSGDTVVALFSHVDNWRSKGGIQFGASREQFASVYGQPVASILKGNTRWVLNSDVYLIDGSYVTPFFDEHDSGKMVGILAIDEQTELAFSTFESAPSAAYVLGMELQIFDLANAVRVRMGLKPFRWDDAIAGTAKKHSKDMAANAYMDHTNLEGESPWDRMEEDGIRYLSAAENVAAGYPNAMLVHDGWMNSLGHRNNILSTSNEYLGVGVAFSSKPFTMYGTQLFYTPMPTTRN